MCLWLCVSYKLINYPSTEEHTNHVQKKCVNLSDGNASNNSHIMMNG